MGKPEKIYRIKLMMSCGCKMKIEGTVHSQITHLTSSLGDPILGKTQDYCVIKGMQLV